jgi:hypothetical protein
MGDVFPFSHCQGHVARQLNPFLRRNAMKAIRIALAVIILVAAAVVAPMVVTAVTPSQTANACDIGVSC